MRCARLESSVEMESYSLSQLVSFNIVRFIYVFTLGGSFNFFLFLCNILWYEYSSFYVSIVLLTNI